MKKTVLFLLLGCSPAVPTLAWAQDNPPPPSHEEHQPDGGSEGRMKNEMARFHEEMANHMKSAMEKASQLESEGRKEEADEVRAQARKKMQSAIEDHQRAMQAKMQEMHQRQRAQKIENSEREREARREKQRAGGAQREGGPDRPDGDDRPKGPDRRPDGPPPADAMRKLRHVEQAIGHLREAGLPDPAANLERVAQRLRQAMHDQGGSRPDDGPRAERGPRPEAGPGPDGPRREDALGSLRREVEELRKMVNDLSKMREQELKKESPEKHH